MTTPPHTEKARGTPARAWLLLIPFVWQVAAVPWANDVHLAFLPVPFLMVWEMAGIVVTSIVLGLMYVLDRRSS